MTPSVLVVDDETQLRDLLVYNLEREGFAVTACGDGDEALRLAVDRRPDVVVLDLMLPGTDGWQVLRQIRRTSDLPVLVLSARQEEVDRVLGLELGADDYVTKPFSVRELVARLRAILRRVQTSHRTGGRVVAVGDLHLDESTCEARVGDRPVRLTATEFQILWTLASSPGRVFSRQQLLDRVWGADFIGDPRTVDVHVRHLRAKLEADPGRPELLETVRGFGYRVAAP